MTDHEELYLRIFYHLSRSNAGADSGDSAVNMKTEINKEKRKLQHRVAKAQEALDDAAECLCRLVAYLEIAKSEHRAEFNQWINKTNLTLAEARELINLHRHYRKTGRIDRKLVEDLGIMQKPRRIRRQHSTKKKTLLHCIAQLTDRLEGRELSEMDKVMLEPLKRYTDDV